MSPADLIAFNVNAGNDGELRIADTELATGLGYAKVSNLRDLIRRHQVTLSAFGVLRTVRKTPSPEFGGRPGLSYELTEHQAAFIIGKSDTPEADAIHVEIVKAFVAARRSSLPLSGLGILSMEMLGFAPRSWEREYDEKFWSELHRVGGWKRPQGNNHSNCAHFINRYVYEYLFGQLGLQVLQEANPSEDGQRALKHHQILKDKHMPRLRSHIAQVTAMLSNSVSLSHFSDQFNRAFPASMTQIGFLFQAEAPRIESAA